MPNPARILGQLKRHWDSELDSLALEIQRQYENREFQCQEVPLIRRGKDIFRRPNTALIAYAGQRKILRRQIAALVEWKLDECSTDMTLEEQVNDLISIRDFLISRRRVQIVEHQEDACTAAQS